MVSCPQCDSVLDIEEEDLDEGDEFTCDECGVTLRVVDTNPIELEPADEDDDEDEDEDEDDSLDEDEEEEEEDEDDEDWR